MLILTRQHLGITSAHMHVHFFKIHNCKTLGGFMVSRSISYSLNDYQVELHCIKEKKKEMEKHVRQASFKMVAIGSE